MIILQESTDIISSNNETMTRIQIGNILYFLNVNEKSNNCYFMDGKGIMLLCLNGAFNFRSCPNVFDGKLVDEDLYFDEVDEMHYSNEVCEDDYGGGVESEHYRGGVESGHY